MTSTELSNRPAYRYRIAVGLFFLAPLIGEFLLGNLPITWLGTIVLMAPLYGGGSILIRETARRFRMNWTGILALCATYSVAEEAFVTYSLFNPNYVGQRLLDPGYIPILGIGAWWTVFVFGLHVIWSTAIPIAIAETWAGPDRTRPWIGRVGLALVAVICAGGSVALNRLSVIGDPTGFQPSVAQFVGAAIVCAGFLACAFTLGRRQPASADHEADVPGAPGAANHIDPPTVAPSPWTVGVAGLLLGSAYMISTVLQGIVVVSVSSMLIAMAVAWRLGVVWSQRPGWGDLHRLAYAAGGMCTYIWWGLMMPPSVGNETPWQVDLAGNLIFSAAALTMTVLTVKALNSRSTSPAVLDA